jgi:hypothetical protein
MDSDMIDRPDLAGTVHPSTPRDPLLAMVTTMPVRANVLQSRWF